MATTRVRLAAFAAVLSMSGALVVPADASTGSGAASGPGSSTVIDGHARFEVLTPTLIRLEYAGDGHFQDGKTFNVVNRGFPTPAYTTTATGGWRVIKTSKLTLRYQQGSGPFGPDNTSVTLTVAGQQVTAHPSWQTQQPAPPSSPGALGGWYRGLDSYSNQAGPPSGITLHPGLLDRDGYYLLDDSQTAVQNPDGSYAPRPGHGGLPYQDGYFFGYGQDYKQALRDLRLLTGPAPLLPEWAFGFWYSNRYAQPASYYQDTMIPRFRSEHVPIDLLTLDTDWKAPDNWNGWNWNTSLYPDPQAFLDWAKSQDLKIMLNIHPSIRQSDPQLPYAQQVADGALQPGPCPGGNCYVFDWSDPRQANAYFALHKPFEQQGVRQWWFDWCCDQSKVSMPGVTPDSYINQLYRQETDARGLRGFSLARIGASYPQYNQVYPSGAWAEHRNTVHFTGDTQPTWDSLAFASYLTASEGASIGLPYVSHDIGSFLGGQLPDDYYVRWLQFATFQPIFRVHGHGDRLPWSHPAAAKDAAEKFIRLREALVPYSYSLAEQAHRTGIPMVRAMYLDYPGYDEAYTFKTQYLYGDDVLVAPIVTPNDASGTGSVSVWFPPGRWTDYFTGQTFTGPATRTVTAGLDTMPVFLKAGAIVPQRTDYVDNVTQRPLGHVTVNVAPGAAGTFQLYEDAGEGHGYSRGQYATTPLTYRENAPAPHRLPDALTIGGQRGDYPGRVSTRQWTVRFADTDLPTTVTINGQVMPQSSTGTGWSYDPAARVLTVRTGPVPTRAANTVIAHD